MKIISTNAELSKQLKRLIKQYPKIAIATAWASAATDVFKVLVQNEGKIVRAVIGTHFYQTHPDVLDQFVGSSKVQFILQPDGVFHPKVYVFWSAKAWEVVIGSPNLTVGALTKNSELSVLISSDDVQPELKQEFLAVIKGYSEDAATISQSEANNYRSLWKLKSRDLTKVADIFGDKKSNKPAVQSRVMPLDWASYLEEVKKDTTHGFKERLAMLKAVREQFDKYEHFNDIPFDARRGIAGLDSETIPNPKWFGSMTGAGVFYGLINKGHEAFSLALDEIPSVGEVRKEHYDRYIAEYKKAYPKGRDGLGTATRLLAMKRPDVFLCVDSKNLDMLAKDVGMVKAGLGYERYWGEVVLRLMESPWWQSPEPTNATEKAVWRARAAMLDAIFYEEG
ncbi:phospholipase D family protein [Ideonella margarita]|uniref:Phospholipase D family protein n=1 Tax=Ideonella margarita TaxID=2984191 RepID=A0ABU9C9G4_9BURK